MLAQPESLTQIVALIKPSISKGKVQSSTLRQQKIQILCETLWTLNNLAYEGSVDVTEVLFLDHNITSILQMHLMENFIGENELQEQESVCHLSSQAASLLNYELELLDDIIWLLANLALHEPIAYSYIANHVDKLVYLVTRTHHQ